MKIAGLSIASIIACTIDMFIVSVLVNATFILPT